MRSMTIHGIDDQLAELIKSKAEHPALGSDLIGLRAMFSILL
jgi:hypothetical protein